MNFINKITMIPLTPQPSIPLFNNVNNTEENDKRYRQESIAAEYKKLKKRDLSGLSELQYTPFLEKVKVASSESKNHVILDMWKTIEKLGVDDNDWLKWSNCIRNKMLKDIEVIDIIDIIKVMDNPELISKRIKENSSVLFKDIVTLVRIKSSNIFKPVHTVYTKCSKPLGDYLEKRKKKAEAKKAYKKHFAIVMKYNYEKIKKDVARGNIPRYSIESNIKEISF